MTRKPTKRPAKKKPRTVQRSVYWEPGLVNKVDRDRASTHRSWSAHVAWIVEIYFADQKETAN